MAEKYRTFFLQHPFELEEFCNLIKSEEVRSYLEIGSKFGGSLWRVAHAMPIGSRVVSIDLPWGDGSFKQSQPWLEKCAVDLRQAGYDCHLLIADSHLASSKHFADLLGPYDCVMIDGDHTAEGVEADWNDYGSMGRMVAFHDINWKPRASKKPQIKVPEFWNDLKYRFKSLEICHDKQDNGIGVLWRF